MKWSNGDHGGSSKSGSTPIIVSLNGAEVKSFTAGTTYDLSFAFSSSQELMVQVAQGTLVSAGR